MAAINILSSNRTQANCLRLRLSMFTEQSEGLSVRGFSAYVYMSIRAEFIPDGSRKATVEARKGDLSADRSGSSQLEWVEGSLGTT